MGLEQERALSAAATDAVLARNETGVLALAANDEPYAIPISYGYDADDRRFYLRLVSTPDSEKRRFLDARPTARLVVYEEDGQTYRSVVITGTLAVVDTDDLTVDHIEQYGKTKRPLFEIWGSSKQNLDIELYELESESVTGREIVVQRED